MVSDRLRVLLVDDHPLLREAVADSLGRASIDVVGQAGSAEEGLALALRLRPDVILLDIDLPGTSGVSIVQPLVSQLPETKVAMLTVSTAHEHLVRAIADGASGYLTKDMGPDALVRAVRSLAAGDMAMSRPATETLTRAGTRDKPEPRRLGQLTPRERQILGLLIEGLTDRAIAARLAVSPRTIETHISNIVDRLRVQNRAEAVAVARADDSDQG